MCISASPNRDALFLCPDFIGGIPIRKRNNRVVVHLNDAELSKLEQDTATAGMCREKYIRLALMGIIIHPRPPDNYGKVLQQLSAYGNNLNAANKKEGHRLRRGGPLFCLLFVRSRGKMMLKVISVKMYSALLEVQYVYRP